MAGRDGPGPCTRGRGGERRPPRARRWRRCALVRHPSRPAARPPPCEVVRRRRRAGPLGRVGDGPSGRTRPSHRQVSFAGRLADRADRAPRAHRHDRPRRRFFRRRVLALRRLQNGGAVGAHRAARAAEETRRTQTARAARRAAPVPPAAPALKLRRVRTRRRRSRRRTTIGDAQEACYLLTRHPVGSPARGAVRQAADPALTEDQTLPTVAFLCEAAAAPSPPTVRSFRSAG